MNLLNLREDTLEHVLLALEYYDEQSDWGDQQDAKMEFRNLIDQVREVTRV